MDETHNGSTGTNGHDPALNEASGGGADESFG